jgi:hypothetical protein
MTGGNEFVIQTKQVLPHGNTCLHNTSVLLSAALAENAEQHDKEVDKIKI